MNVTYIILLVLALAIYMIVSTIRPFKSKWTNFLCFIFLLSFMYYGFLHLFEVMEIVPDEFSYIPIAISLFVYIALNVNEASAYKVDKSKAFFLETTDNDKIYFGYPNDNFLILGGAGSGKTKSIGKPLMEQFIMKGWAGFIYDYKDFDYTKTAYNLCKKHNYPHEFYYVSFTDLKRTYRFNPLDPEIVKSETLLFQLMDDILSASIPPDTKKDEWFQGALGILRGVAWVLYDRYRDMCTLPHILNLILMADKHQLFYFLDKYPMSRMLAGAFIDAKGSERTQASFLSTLSNYITTIATNKNVAYVLTEGTNNKINFKFNLVDQEYPKLFAVANNFALESILSPIISMLMVLSARQIEFGNTTKFVYILDEMTTFKVRDFQNFPSVLREYGAAFVILTQSGAKLEKLYGKFDRSSIEANCSNLFLGRTKDVEALKYYPLFFGKEERKKKSKSSGSSNSGHNSSVTISTQKEEVYESKDFSALIPGQFIGMAGHTNKPLFDVTFKQFSLKEEGLPILAAVTKDDVNENFDRILREVISILPSSFKKDEEIG